jgi:homopolymeric O-antigen transport system ATP-binding protein
MNDLAIQVENLGKQYRIATRSARYKTLRDSLTNAVVAPFRRLGAVIRNGTTSNGNGLVAGDDNSDMFWALREVSCNVTRGEVVGVIGRNGAGKSTFLKILSRITEPTAGSVDIYGRVGSLLEVGTGFHPELSGRENIYLNGAILGMKKSEIDRKFDEIVAFAETERFIDTSVKHYSSGMYLRLAFAVAAHLDPEILLVDEVLAVGDASFQKKCLGKMGDVAKQGRTVLFVSHNMGAITQLCGRALWVENGRIALDGPPSRVVPSYLLSGGVSTASWVNSEPALRSLPARIISTRILGSDDKLTSLVDYDKEFKIEICYQVFAKTNNLNVRHRITDTLGNIIWVSWDTDTTSWKHVAREPGLYRSSCIVPAKLLRPGRYFLSIGPGINVKVLAYHEHILSFDVSEVGYSLNLDRAGIITPLLKWEVHRIDAEDNCFSGHDGQIFELP